MKSIKIIATIAIVFGSLVACTPKSSTADATKADGTTAVNPKTLLPSKGQTDSVSYLIGIQFGSFIKGYNFGDDLNYAQIKKGMLDFINAKGNFRDSSFAKQFKVNPELINDMFSAFLAKRSEYTSAVNLQKEEKFLAENQKKDSVQVTESGLQYKIINAGDAQKIGAKDTVFVHYKGTLTDGSTFDEVPASAKSGRFTLDRVVSGWKEGLQLIGPNGKIKLVIPSKLGYGPQAMQGIEANSTLLFDIQVDSVIRYVEPAVEEVKK